MPPHSPEAMQDLAKTVASLLWKDEPEVLALLQRSAYGRQQAPVPLPDTEQASCLACAQNKPSQPGLAQGLG